MIAVWIVLVVALASTSALKVTTSLGAIRGVTLKTPLGKDIYAFRGIRYANAPVGELRFRNPQPVDPWKPKVFDATDDGPICPQTGLNSTDYSEDCLRINVYSKNLDPKALRQVLIYLHRGRFSAGSGRVPGPVSPMDDDSVLVTINYRLGMLGFLATGTADAPGNAGLKDQVVAFRWVRDHIHNFGGNPHSVTLLDFSAGGLNTGLHMASPMSKGLFVSGYEMSPSSIKIGEYPLERQRLAKLHARLVKCPTYNIHDLVECLRKTSVEALMTISHAKVDDRYKRTLNWMVVIEKDFGQERFITEDPKDSYQAGRVHMVPLMIAMNKNMFFQLASDVLQNENLTQFLNENWQTHSPICFQYERTTPKSVEVSGIIRNKLVVNKLLKDVEPLEPLGKIFSDSVFTFDHLAAKYVPIHYTQLTYKRYHLNIILAEGELIMLLLKAKI